MGRGSGAGGLIAILALALLFIPRKLTSADFSGAFQPPHYSPTYSQYYEYVTKTQEELAPGEAFEDQTTIGGKTGRWLTVNGRIPTPSGTTIPIPTIHVGRTAVDMKLEPIEEAKEEPHFQDVGGRRSVNLRLKPIG